MCVASRGRGPDNEQHFEARTDGCSSTITSVAKDNYLMEIETPYFQQLQEQGIRLPAILCQIRTDEGRKKRKQGIEVFRFKFLTPRADGMCNTITGVTKDNLLMAKTENQPQLIYHPTPTKEDLLEYFGKSSIIRIRKMVPREAGRLMGLYDEEIDKIECFPFKSPAERAKALAKADKKEITRIKRESICKTAQYKLYGNSIVVDCLYHQFRTLFISDQPENKNINPIQLSLFDF